MQDHTYQKRAQITAAVTIAFWAALAFVAGCYFIFIAVKFDSWKWLAAAPVIWLLGGLHMARSYYNYMYQFEVGENIEQILANQNRQLSVREATMARPKAAISESHGMIEGISGSLAGTKYEISDREELLVGRDPSICRLVIHKEGVSRKHCSIRYEGSNGRYCVTDYSTNGTYIDGAALQKGIPFYARQGSTLAIGASKEQFLLK